MIQRYRSLEGWSEGGRPRTRWPPEIHPRKHAGAVAQRRGLHEVAEPLRRRHDGPADPFPAISGQRQGIDRGLTIKINNVEAHEGTESDVGARMFCPPRRDHLEIRCGVVQSMTGIGCGDQVALSEGEWEDGEALLGIGECSGEMVHSRSLFRQRVNAQLTMNDNGKSWSFVFGRAKISSLDPPLATVRASYSSQPLLALFHPSRADPRLTRLRSAPQPVD
jgi:hypothetical protein